MTTELYTAMVPKHGAWIEMVHGTYEEAMAFARQAVKVYAVVRIRFNPPQHTEY